MSQEPVKRSSRSDIEAVSEPAHTNKVARLRRVLLDLIPEIVDMCINDAVRKKNVLVPYQFDKPVETEHLPYILKQRPEQLEFKRSQIYFPAAAQHRSEEHTSELQ